MRDEGSTTCAILVVDDDELQRQVLCRRLQKLGCAVEEAEDGAAAFRQWQAGNFDLILCDWHMPEMDGFELARQIRSAEAASAAPGVVFICQSAEPFDATARFASLQGQNRFVQKPLMAAALKDIVALASENATAR